jgi:hypothetical protein
VNLEQAGAIRDRLRGDPRDIRVLCPRGHYIAHIRLHVPDTAPEPSISMQPRGRSRRMLSTDQKRADVYGVHAYTPARGRRYVRVQCPQCPYDGKFDYEKLAVELAVHALAGHAGHQLST